MHDLFLISLIVYKVTGWLLYFEINRILLFFVVFIHVNTRLLIVQKINNLAFCSLIMEITFIQEARLYLL